MTAPSERAGVSIAPYRELIIGVVAGSAPAAVGFEAQYVRLRVEESGVAQDLLDQLAAEAKQSAPALELLLRLVRRHGLARPAIRRLLVNEDDIDDVEQASLAAVAVGIGAFEGRSRFSTWVHTIAGNEAKLLLRHRSRRPVGQGELPEQAYLARLSTLLGEREAIRAAIDRLPDEQRTVLIAREVDGFGYDEIAADLGIPIGTVRSRLHRAREMVAVELRSEGRL